MRKGMSALAVVFLLAHLPFLPPTLEDIDSINFALGVRDFDVARHQPHPPGYPIYIALGKISTPVMRALGVPAPEVRGLAVWSAISGAALVLLLFALFRAMTADDDWFASVAAQLVAFCPLFWFTALRPLSDTTGLAAAVAAQVSIVRAMTGGGRANALMAGAFVAGLAIGVRSQTFLLTLPLLALALGLPRPAITMRVRLGAVAALALGVLAWAIPLVAISGGPEAYMAALGTQAGEDFSGVVMLWNLRAAGFGTLARVGADALVQSLLWPWGHPLAGALAIVVALAGAVRAAWRAPRLLLILAVGFVPYAIFHLLFHEVVTVRYALPLVVPVVFLAVYALDGMSRPVARVTAIAASVGCLLFVVKPTIAYGREGSPAFRALEAAATDVDVPRSGEQVVAFHAVARRAAEWMGDALHAKVLKAPHGREWLTLVEQWRANPRSTITFIADPRRTDLALFDHVSRAGPLAFRWAFVEPPFVGGARPGNSDLYVMRPPGWMLERGWALTPEVAGITARDGWGPHLRPSVAWVKARESDALLMIGGRNLAAAGSPAARVTLTLGGALLDEIEAPPGFFFKLVPLPSGSLGPAGAYVPLEVQAHAADLSAQAIPVGLEQFDVQNAGAPMVGAQDGWQEPEYNPLTYRSWRWTSERATLWVRPIGRDVTLTLSGESPLRYYDAAPAVTVMVGTQRVAQFSPAADFVQSIVLPAAALERADGRVTIESDKWFVPGERDGSADKRHLALRIYSYTVSAK